MMRKHFRWVAVGAAVLVPAAIATPALAASSPVTVSLTTSAPSGGRTLVLQDTAGQALSALNLSSGATGFIAKVVDSNYANNGFTVQATMSNLYGFNTATNTWNCAQKVPSSAVSLASSSGLLDVNGLLSSVTPNFVLNGDLSTVLSSILGLLTSGTTVTNAPVTGLVQNLTQSNLTGGLTGDLVGSTLSGLTGLPINLATGAGGAFTNPAADPTGANCGVTGTNATNDPIMNGTANPLGLVSDVQALLNSLTNTLSSTLITGGFLDTNAVMNEVSSVLSAPLSLLSPLTSSIEGTLTATLANVPLVSSLTSQSGNYSATPKMTVNTSGVPAGSYRGTLTVTLADS